MKARIINLPDSQNMLIKNISKEHIGKLISVDGKVISQSDVWLESICSKFECPACGAELLMMQSGDEIKQPSRCACGYKSSFKQLKTIFADVQELILQDLSDETKKKASQIRIIAKNDLAGAEMSRNTAEGKRICVYGIVEENKGTSGRSHKTPGRVIIANNIKPI